MGEEQQREVEEQHVQRIAPPALLLGRVDPREAIEAALDGAEESMERGGAAFVACEEPATTRLGARREDGDEEAEAGTDGRTKERRVGEAWFSTGKYR